MTSTAPWQPRKEYAAHQNQLAETEAVRKAREAAVPQLACVLAEYNNGVPCEQGKDPNYPQLWCHACMRNKITRAIVEFPAEFGMRAYPGKRFKISPDVSYFSDYPYPGTMYLYTLVLSSDGTWKSFCKGTASELRSEIVNLKPALLSKEEAAAIRKQSTGGAR